MNLNCKIQNKSVSHLRKSHLTELCIKDILNVLDASYQKEVKECFKFLLEKIVVKATLE